LLLAVVECIYEFSEIGDARRWYLAGSCNLWSRME
jgi:hypothetical protein